MCHWLPVGHLSLSATSFPFHWLWTLPLLLPLPIFAMIWSCYSPYQARNQGYVRSDYRQKKKTVIEPGLYTDLRASFHLPIASLHPPSSFPFASQPGLHSFFLWNYSRWAANHGQRDPVHLRHGQCLLAPDIRNWLKPATSRRGKVTPSRLTPSPLRIFVGKTLFSNALLGSGRPKIYTHPRTPLRVKAQPVPEKYFALEVWTWFQSSGFRHYSGEFLTTNATNTKSPADRITIVFHRLDKPERK